MEQIPDSAGIVRVIERLRGAVEYHQEAATEARAEIESCSWDVMDGVAAYNDGKAQAYATAIDLLLGREVTLYHETRNEST